MRAVLQPFLLLPYRNYNILGVTVITTSYSRLSIFMALSNRDYKLCMLTGGPGACPTLRFQNFYRATITVKVVMRLRASPRPETALTCVYSCFGWGYCNPDQSHLAVVIDAADETLFQQVLIHRNHIFTARCSA